VATTLFLCLLVSSSAAVRAQEWEPIDIPHTKYLLDNGLTLLVHEDHKAPIVAVNIWYHVGSKNEKLGRTGFAHLFEHLMFNGSEHYNDDYFKVLQRIGATTLNGTTWFDRTNYFQNVPKTALDTVLWMESDRMGFMLAAIDQAKLDEQRGVVQNEKRQGENQPYGGVDFIVQENAFPQGHPYSWDTIGYMEDLQAATLEDVHEWFKAYYGAANAVIAIAGDITPEEAREKVGKYFGNIPAGPPVTKQQAWIANRTGEHRMTMQDRVPQARIYKEWNIPEWGTPENVYLDLVGDILAEGKNSRLYKRLIYDEQIATDVEVNVFPFEIAGMFVIQADARPGVELEEVERAIDEELARFLKDGPTVGELQRVKTQRRAAFIRGVERIGGFGGKSDVLARNQVYGGDADHHKITQRRIHEATAHDLQGEAQKWLSDGVLALEVHPFAEYATTGTDADRSAVPEAGAPPAAEFPALQRAELSNGLEIVLAERHTVPQVNFNLLLDAGYAADQNTMPGTASMTMDMLDEGTQTRDALQISEELALLGANLGTGSNLDMSSVTLSALKENLEASLELFADVILNPAFPGEELERLRKQRLARIQQEKAQPFQMALRVLPYLFYGEGHAYATPFTGSGTEESVAKMLRDDLTKFHQAWFKPNHATLIVVGDTTLDEIVPKLEGRFAGWAPGDIPRKDISEVAHREKPTVYLMDRPGALQSVIFAGHLAPPRANPQEEAIETMNMVLGGNFISRMNMNLREDKHWAYFARTFIVDARGQRPFFAITPVQTDKTKESVAEVLKELKGILGEIPVTEDEVSRAKAAQTLTLPGRWEAMSAVMSSVAEIVRFGLPDDYYQTYADSIRAVGLGAVETAADTVVHPGNLVWVVVGDREKIESTIRELGIGEIQVLNPDGTVMQAAATD
jgi:zinc protease